MVINSKQSSYKVLFSIVNHTGTESPFPVIGTVIVSWQAQFPN